MNKENKTMITVQAVINAPIEKVWKLWTPPEHICKWNFASPEWHAPSAVNDLKAGGKFVWRMEAKDGSFGFDFSGVYTEIKIHDRIHYTMDDERIAELVFVDHGNRVELTEHFEAETENPIDLQRGGWQAILDNFKKYAEGF